MRGANAIDQMAAITLKKHQGVVDILRVGRCINEADTGCGTAFDLVFQARSGAVFRRMSPTLALQGNIFCKSLRLSLTALALGYGPK
jgi:hypothetical protein